MEDLSKHEAVPILNKPLIADHHLFDELKKTYMTFNYLVIAFKTGLKFKNTDDLARAIRQMILDKMKVESTDFENLDKLTEFHKYFEFMFEKKYELAGLVLVRKADMSDKNS